MNRYFQTPPGGKNLIIINLLVYMAMALIPEAYRFLNEFGALQVGPRMLGYKFHTYQFVTYMFLHANFEHIFFNTDDPARTMELYKSISASAGTLTPILQPAS